MSYNLFLDDERNPEGVYWVEYHPGPWEIVRTQTEFVEIVTAHGMPDFISFDNDLGTGCGEGRDCARWLVEQVLSGTLEYNPEFSFRVHSMNPIAAEWIRQYLESFQEHWHAAHSSI